MRKLLISTLVVILSVTTPNVAVAATEVIKLMRSHLDITRPSGCPSRWCACYMNIVLDALGYETTGSNRARDFSSYGEPAPPASVGSIMVMRNHVAVVTGTCGANQVQIISGNYSRRVSVGCEPISKAIAWRTPVK